jgi:hypothetical protein
VEIKQVLGKPNEEKKKNRRLSQLGTEEKRCLSQLGLEEEFLQLSRQLLKILCGGQPSIEEGK